jgi:hypothetical protein
MLCLDALSRRCFGWNTDALARIKPTEPLRLTKREARKKRNCCDTGGLFIRVILLQPNKKRRESGEKVSHLNYDAQENR